MIRVIASTGTVGGKGEGFEEPFDVTTWCNAELEIKQIITEFNRVETARYGDKAQLRELRKVLYIEPKKEEPEPIIFDDEED